ncbi:cytochrome c oxidase subunit 4 [Leucobacter massiliensis]|uniref:Cytochrome c oxidase polypeptide 4 n=1 Tax=Leucobacter massiliensis TaxID=1686285 RepID=A0A2S9QQX9_9MICO|nr:cytochrome c oxidase subunit 4 [Leucobacter massiliensis]PRI11989.1 cytochrome c oxidase subunit IV [Leucobacter massiliensis]
MKSNIVIFWVLTAYFVVVGTAYTIFSWIVENRIEWAGSTAIVLSGALTGFIAFYLMLVQRKQGGVLVEDRLDSDIDDGDPELGEFSPWSWWPIFLAFGPALVIVGLCIGFHFWLSFLALPLVAIGVVGWVFEYYRGNFAR